MGVRPGYKQTEVGVIPEDWSVVNLARLTDPNRPIGYGIVQTGPRVMDGVRCLRVVDIVDLKIDETNLITTSTEISQSYKRTILVPDDLVIALRGKLGAVAKIGKSLEGANLTRGVALLSKSDQYLPDYLKLYLSSNVGQDVIEKNLNGSALQEIPIASLRRLPIVTPSLPEQRAIAAALSDVDAALAGILRLISKKRDLKQATMQTLLTGQTRLPGFSEEWEVKRLGELLQYEQPTKYLVSDAEYSESYETPVLTAGKTFILGKTNETQGVFSDLPVIIFDDFTTATQYVDFQFKAKSSAMKILKLRSTDNNIMILHEIMKATHFVMSDHKRYWISEYQHIEIKLPDPREQIAIASVLSDFDAEIAALTAQAEKTRLLKQSMMQELLTGRTRLPILDDAHV